MTTGRRQPRRDHPPTILNALDQVPGLRFGGGFVRRDGVLGPAHDPAQSLARYCVIAVPEQMPQSFHIDLSKIERGKGRRLKGAQAAHDLLDMVHAHGEMKPIQNILHGAARGRSHQGWQRGVAVADYGDRLALPPALILQRRAQQCMGLLGHAAHHRRSVGWRGPLAPPCRRSPRSSEPGDRARHVCRRHQA